MKATQILYSKAFAHNLYIQSFFQRRRQMYTEGHVHASYHDVNQTVLDQVKQIIPPLEGGLYKGQAGKIAVIGGCREFTGAPWFAAMSALRVGADLSHVFCTEGAASVIKSYSPEIIVHPYLKESTEVQSGEPMDAIIQSVENWLPRFDCLVIGPGMGRDGYIMETVTQIMILAKKAQMLMVIDADGLFLVSQQPELVTGYNRVILTPNLNEYKRLADKLGIEVQGFDDDGQEKLKHVCRALQGPVIVSKGPADVVADGNTVILCEQAGAPRRCGGQGDVLSGSIAVFATWGLKFEALLNKQNTQLVGLKNNPLILGAYGACHLVRATSHETFKSRRRSMVAGDLINNIGQMFNTIFDGNDAVI
eukprot:TRINITY_DN5980_c0_g2_i2.p1 TRINITY_DN5980_c0_g2~~TRINITY_DN5980_c0_g2_i2.p1  ORF type:complete len:364 (+),score=28.98 TRINITY_DN5980_c0_g2_i2:47-1138(+)